jgi:hypothetical protein
MLSRLCGIGATLAMAAAIAAGISACDSGAPPSPEDSAASRIADAVAGDQPASDPTVMEVRDENAIDIGDVEQALNIVGTVSRVSEAENVTEQITQDRKELIRSVHIEVAPPIPGSFWIGVRVNSTREFVERPVVLDTNVLVDGEKVDSFTIVLWKEAHKNKFQRDVDVLFGREEIPDTMLVTMESEALLLPEGTDLATTDPYSVTEGQRTTAIMHAPIRIDFKKPDPKTQAEEAAPPTTEPAPDAS